jgi:hypothetical protein
MARTMDLEATRGDTWYWEFQVLQSDRSTPQDITGAQFRFTAKVNLADDDSAAVIVGTTASGACQVTNATSGIVTVKLPPIDTAAVTAPGTYQYDLQARDGAGDVWTVAQGRLKVYEDVSRTTP